MKAITEPEFLTALDSQDNIEDKGHIGLGMITPSRNLSMANSPTSTGEAT